MREISKTNTCERVEDLIGFLYGELNETDAKRFELHLRGCDACEVEFRAFGKIRTSIGEWRNEALGARSPAFSEQQTFAAATSPVRVRTKPSALAALHEFFALSPLWMKGAAAFASLLFCVCVVLTVAYLKANEPRTVRVIPDKPSLQQEIDQQVAVEVQKRINDLQAQQKETTTHVVQMKPAPRRVINPSSISPRSETARASRPFTPRERQELAADLRLVTSTGDDDDLDFTGDSNRPRP